MYKLIFPLMMISLMISAPLKKDMHSVKKVILPPKKPPLLLNTGELPSYEKHV